jgi:nitroreductase
VPTAGNIQAYRIVVVRDPSIKNNLYIAARKQVQVLKAPVCLVFFAAQEESQEKYRSRGTNLYSIQDATNACMMTALACAEEKLGTCWVGSFSDEDVIKVYFPFPSHSSLCNLFFFFFFL